MLAYRPRQTLLTVELSGILLCEENRRSDGEFYTPVDLAGTGVYASKYD